MRARTLGALALGQLAAIGAFLAVGICGMLAYRLLVKRLIFWAFRGDREGAAAAVGKLALPYYLLLGLVALWAGRMQVGGTVPAGLDQWFGKLIGPAVAFLIIESVRVAVFECILTSRRKVAVPGILRDIAFGLVYLVVALFFISAVYRIDITPFLTLSGLMSLVLGMALQDTLGNLFAGLAINLERPFQIGEWVSVDGEVARVLEITWRATKFLTRRDELIIIPNNAIARAKIINYQLPNSDHAQEVKIGVGYSVPPTEVAAAIMGCTSQTPGILPDPAAEVFLSNFGDSAIEYTVRVWIQDFFRVPEILSDFRFRVWYRFQQRGIDIPFPIRTVRMQDDNLERAHDLGRKLDTFKSVDFLGVLDESEQQELANQARIIKFMPGELVFEQGEPGSSLYVIAKGQVALSLGVAGQSKPLALLGEGAFFGEFALLTGEPRSASARAVVACELVELRKDDLEILFHQRPEVALQISKVIGERKAQHELARSLFAAEIESRSEAAAAQVASAEEASTEIFNRIRAFFRLT